MHPEMVFNELSTLIPARDDLVARDMIERFVLTLRAFTARGLPRHLRVKEDFRQFPLAQGYYWSDWSSDKRVRRELRQFFMSVVTKAPYLIDEPAAQDRSIVIDVLFSGQRALGLGAAYLLEGLAVSLDSSPEWNATEIVVRVQELAGDGIAERNETVRHANQPEHASVHVNWVDGRLKLEIRRGADIWERRAEYFPCLGFCDGLEQQLAHLPQASLASIVRGLFALNRYCLEWRAGHFDNSQIECSCSPESEPTLQKFGEERIFVCPDGQKRVFSWHAKLGHSRVHFHPDAGPGHLWIGYAGRHLRTVAF